MLDSFAAFFDKWVSAINSLPVIGAAFLVVYKFGFNRGESSNAKTQLVNEKAEHEKTKEERDIIKRHNQALEAELRQLKEVAYFRHWGYAPSDPPVRAPLCPKCDSRMGVAHIDGGYITAKERVHVPILELTCFTCNKTHRIEGEEREGLLRALESKKEPEPHDPS
jgi:hypothetical protein